MGIVVNLSNEFSMASFSDGPLPIIMIESSQPATFVTVDLRDFKASFTMLFSESPALPSNEAKLSEAVFIVVVSSKVVSHFIGSPINHFGDCITIKRESACELTKFWGSYRAF